MFRNSFYGDAVRELDWGVGRILSAVKRSASHRRTLVVFTSDNGAALGASLPTLLPIRGALRP